MASTLRMPKSSNQMIWVVNNIAREIAKENDGKIPDVSIIDLRLKQKLMTNPELMNIDKYSTMCRKKWEDLNHKVLRPEGMTGIIFIPGAFLTVGKRIRVQMKKAKIADIVGWQQVDDEARDNFLETLAMRADYRNSRLREFAANPDCVYLGQIEARFHGYIEKPGDETAHFSSHIPDEDE